MIDKYKDADIIRKSINDSLPSKDTRLEMMLKENKRWGLPLSVALIAFNNVNTYKKGSKKYNSKILFIKNKFIEDYTDEIYRKKIIQNAIIINSLRKYFLTPINDYDKIMSELDELLDQEYKPSSFIKKANPTKCYCRNKGIGFCFCRDNKGDWIN